MIKNNFTLITYLNSKGGWYLGASDTNCIDTCNLHNLECSGEEFFRQNNDIDSSEEVLSLIKKLGGRTSASFCSGQYGKKVDFPSFNPKECYYSDSSRFVPTIDCGKMPFPLNRNKQRLCWCHPSHPTGKLNSLTKCKAS